MDEDLRNQGTGSVKEKIGNMIRGASVVVFMIGENTHAKPWIDYEIDLGNSHCKEMRVIRVPRTTGAAPQKLKKKMILDFTPQSFSK